MDKRVEKNIENIKNLKQFLIYIVENPKETLVEFPDIYEQLKTQHLLASLENAKWNINPSSLNTLKRTSIKVFDNGFNDLEKLRSLAVEKLENHLKISERKDLNKNDKIKQLENEVEKLERLHLICLNQILEDLNTFKNISNLNSLELAKKISEKATAKIRSLGLNSEKMLELTKNETLRVVK
jgi:hypothetical protein